MADDKTLSRKEKNVEREHNRKAMHIWLFLTPEDDNMKLEDLKKMSTADLTALYNTMASKQVKRMESRAKLEERTAQLLRDNNKLDADAPADTGREPATAKEAKNIRETAEAGINDGTHAAKASTRKPASTKPSTTKEPEMAKTATKKAPAKKAAKKAPAKKAAAPAGEKTRGAPLTNYTYTAIGEKAKGYNPEGLKLQASSARGLVLEAIRKNEAGKTRKQIEAMFPDINTKSALDVLVKYGFVLAKE